MTYIPLNKDTHENEHNSVGAEANIAITLSYESLRLLAAKAKE